jgi:hypothetical protein
MFPFCPADPDVTVIELVPAPEVINQPVGTVHVYDVAFATAVIEYVCPVTAGHCAAVPAIKPGNAGVPGETVTAVDDDKEVPHEFPAVTVMFPFCPADPDVTVIELVPAPEVINQPVGTVHVYDVAFATAVTE